MTRIRTKPNHPVHRMNLRTHTHQETVRCRTPVPHPVEMAPSQVAQPIALHTKTARSVHAQRARHTPPETHPAPHANPPTARSHAGHPRPTPPPPPSAPPDTLAPPPPTVPPACPTHPPRRISGALCPGMGRGVPSTANRPSRGPVAMAPHRPVTAPTRCTTPQPAWSIAPTPSSGVGDSADSQPLGSHTYTPHATQPSGQEGKSADGKGDTGRGGREWGPQLSNGKKHRTTGVLRSGAPQPPPRPIPSSAQSRLSHHDAPQAVAPPPPPPSH